MAQSVMDYIFRRLALDYMERDDSFTCGTKMRAAGSCYVCDGSGSTSGFS